jgi:uncharacterized protein
VRPFRLLFLLLLGATSLAALEVPPPPTRWATDAAGILSVTEESILDKKLEEFEQQTGAQFIIYTFPSIEGESIEEFTIRCVERWKVGQKKLDNGLVLFVFVKERKTRVEVGKGLEGTITDAVSARVIREQIAPHFQRGEYFAGLNAAAEELMRRIRTGEQPVEPLQRNDRGGQRQGGDVNPVVILIILFIVFFVIVPMFSRRRSGCGGCIPLFFFPGGGGGITFGGGGFSGGGGFGGGGGFSGGGGSFGGGGATGGW